jgi:hypothetical protein
MKMKLIRVLAMLAVLLILRVGIDTMSFGQYCLMLALAGATALVIFTLEY